MVEYYFAKRGCSFYTRFIMLAVQEDKRVELHRGHIDDKFKLDEKGKPVCTREFPGLGWNIVGPLNNEDFTKFMNNYENYWTDERKKRIHSVRGLH